MTKKYSVKEANMFINKNRDNLDKKFYPKFHFASEIGWINDPNGVSIFNDEYHLFYQYFPYDSKWGPMHWGHAKSEDGLNWEHLEVALAPDQKYDSGGCFSGSAVEKDGKLYLMYTGHLPNEKDEQLTRQNQNIAISEDGIHFKKYEGNPVLTEKDIPEGSSIVDFRDPKVFEKNDMYYCVIGSKTNDDKGQVLLYKSEDLLEWEYVSVVFSNNEYLGTMVECPDLLLFEDKAVFILSAMNYTDKDTGRYFPHISWIIEGEMDWDAYKFKMRNIKVMDKGVDYYAPQSTIDHDGYTAIAWMQGWGRSLPTDELGHHWAGQMTIPRIISYDGSTLVQKIHPKVEEILEKKNVLSKCEVEDEEILLNENWDYLELVIDTHASDNFDILFLNEKEHLVLSYTKEDRSLQFSRENAHIKIENEQHEEVSISDKLVVEEIEEELTLKIFLDTSSIEFFVNNTDSITNTHYLQEKPIKVAVKTFGKATIKDVKSAIL